MYDIFKEAAIAWGLCDGDDEQHELLKDTSTRPCRGRVACVWRGYGFEYATAAIQILAEISGGLAGDTLHRSWQVCCVHFFLLYSMHEPGFYYINIKVTTLCFWAST